MQEKIGIYGTGTIGSGQATLTIGNGCETVVIGHSKGGQERCRKAERVGYERADDEPDHGQPDGDAPERGRQRRGTDGQAGEEAEGGAEHHFMPMPCSVFISVRMRTAASMIG